MTNRGLLITGVVLLVCIFAVLLVQMNRNAPHESIGGSVNEVVEEIEDEIDDQTTD